MLIYIATLRTPFSIGDIGKNFLLVLFLIQHKIFSLCACVCVNGVCKERMPDTLEPRNLLPSPNTHTRKSSRVEEKTTPSHLLTQPNDGTFRRNPQDQPRQENAETWLVFFSRNETEVPMLVSSSPRFPHTEFKSGLVYYMPRRKSQ